MGARPSIQPRIISHTVDLFAGGMDSDASPYTLAEGQAVLGENVEFYRDNTLRSRKGYTLDTPTNLEGQFVTQRVDGVIQRIFRNTGYYRQETNGVLTVIGDATGTHTMLRTLNGLLFVEPTAVYLYDAEGFQTAAINTPASLTGSSATGGQLSEGVYTYQFNYLIDGGFESPLSPEFNITVGAPGSRVNLTFPATTTHPKMFSIRLYRKNPDDGFPLFIKELPVGTASYTDTGDSQSALMALQGVRPQPGGNLALIHNRRLFTIDGATLNYSYPGNFAYSNVFWTEKVNLPTGEAITAMCPLGQGVIFFGLETALYMNAVPSEGGSFNPIPIPDGCVSQTAWTQAEDGTLIYVGKGGIYAMQGANAQRISDPVSDRFKKYSVGELATATIIFDQQERRLLVALPEEMLVYHFQTKAWAVWTLPNIKLDWFEGRIHIHNGSAFGILGESPTDNGAAISGKFVSGVHGLEDTVPHKLFRRIGLQISAQQQDTVNMSVRALDWDNTYTGLPARPDLGAKWDTAAWDIDVWAGNIDTAQSVALPDTIQGRYIQFSISFSTTNADSFTIMGPVVIEYRARYRYGRR